MNISIREFNAIIKLEPFDRYKYFIKRFADSEIKFSLRDEENEIAIAEVDNKQIISFWPAKEFALTFVTGPWFNYSELQITLDSFKNRLVPIIINGGYLLDVFPLFNKTGFVVDLKEFLKDLESELERY